MAPPNGIAIPRHAVRLSLLGVILGVVVAAPPALAQSQRTFVASSGSDTNPCSRTLPCRSFGMAVTAVAAGGEVVALDSAGYGPFTITKAVTVVAPPGVHAGITVFFSGIGIEITAGASDVVVLRGLTLTGLSGADGIIFNSGGALHVEGLVISGFTTLGIGFFSPGQLFVKDTVVREIAGSGIRIFAATGTASASIEHSQFEGQSLCGVLVDLRGRASIRESVASGNGSGFCAGLDGEISVHNSLAANNSGSGISCNGAGTTRVANSIVTNNGTGLSNIGGCLFESLGNNLVRGNTTNTSGTITSVPGQ